jgi:hypothetical protein
MNGRMAKAYAAALIATLLHLDTRQTTIHYTDYDRSLNEQRDEVGHDKS